MENETNNEGAIYVAFGIPYLAMALYSAATLRKNNPNLPICIITNVTKNRPVVEYWDESMDHFIYMDLKTGDNRKIKTSLHLYTPFYKNIFIDCDTYVIGDISDGFFFLDFFDMAIRPNSNPQQKRGKGNIIILGSKEIFSLPHWNSGVIFFKKNQSMEKFFDNWHRMYIDKAIDFDQISLVEAIFVSDVRLLSLDNRWNSMGFYNQGHKKNSHDIRIVHYTSRISLVVADYIIKYGHCVKINTPLLIEMKQFIKYKRKQRFNKLGFCKFFKLKIKWILEYFLYKTRNAM